MTLQRFFEQMQRPEETRKDVPLGGLDKPLGEWICLSLEGFLEWCSTTVISLGPKSVVPPSIEMVGGDKFTCLMFNHT
jgi:hypothetical protein